MNRSKQYEVELKALSTGSSSPAVFGRTKIIEDIRHEDLRKVARYLPGP